MGGQLDEKEMTRFIFSSVIAKEERSIIDNVLFDMAPPFAEATNDVDDLLT